MVEFRKCFYEFYDIYNLVLTTQSKISVVEVINIKTHSRKLSKGAKIRNRYNQVT